jgi:hypothetical protein
MPGDETSSNIAGDAPKVWAAYDPAQELDVPSAVQAPPKAPSPRR